MQTKEKSPSHFSFCESASGNGPWHIRRLTAAGPKFGGGVDSPALCGRDLHGGWDLDVQITPHHLRHCCFMCAGKYRDSGQS